MSSIILESIYTLAKDDPNRPALSCVGEVLSYFDLAHEISDFATDLEPYQGKCLAIECDNSPQWVIADLACVAAGVVSLPIPPFFTVNQRHHAYQQAGARGVIDNGFIISPLCCERVVLPENTTKITFTSGSTGQPKGVCLSQSGIEQVALSLLEVIGDAPAKKTAALLPLGVLLENIAGCYTTLLAGGCYDVRPQLDIGLKTGQMPDFITLAKYLAESEATSCILVPELLRGLMQALAQSGLRLPQMQFMAVGGSKVSPELLHKAEALGLPVYQGYGLSECASVVAVNTPQHQNIEAVGRPLPHTALDVAEDGEVMVHDPAFLGYLGDEAPVQHYPTGDLGHLDENGYLHITGRKKNLLITGYGRNVSPEWPESALLSQPEIMQCLVFGDGAPTLSALVVPSHVSIPHEKLQAAIDRANSNLPDYAHIKGWRMVQPFTVSEGLLTGTGRPKREAIVHAHRLLIETLNEQEENYANIL